MTGKGGIDGMEWPLPASAPNTRLDKPNGLVEVQVFRWGCKMQVGVRTTPRLDKLD